jgi:membrane fusion protein (multidrug efflux system)
VNAKQSTVDETTRNLQIQATVANARGTLRPGMFVQTELAVGASRLVTPLPASAISHAPYGDSVYVVTTQDHKTKDNKGQAKRTVRQQFVKVEGARGDQVAVISGVKPGDEVVTSGLFKLRNGAAVVINNKARPSNNPAPKPEDS